jgi:uncharacterized protein YqjF (DUF2071 family)
MIWRQHWTDVMFLHFPVQRGELAPLIPAPLMLDAFGGESWVSFVFFRLNVRPAGLPPIPGFSSLLELNVRTYVRHRDQQGIYFLRMYADNGLAIGASRLLTPLQYERATMIDQRCSGGQRRVECRPARPGAGVLRGQWMVSGPLHPAMSGSLAWWLLERYRLFVVRRDGRLLAADVEHLPWQFALASTARIDNDLCRDQGLSLAAPAAIHTSPGVTARFNAFRAVAGGAFASRMHGTSHSAKRLARA